MHPSQVVSPRDRLEAATLKIIYIDPSKEWSIATMTYDEGPAVGLRWNGDINNPKDTGYPNRGEYGQWFILPAAVAALVLALVNALPRASEDSSELDLSVLEAAFHQIRVQQPQGERA